LHTIRNPDSVCSERERMASFPDTKPVLRADARRNRDAVLAAAREEFGKRGLECQVEDIARRAGVGVGTVYRHFQTKDDLLAALVTDRFERLAERAREAVAEEEPWQAFCEMMRFAAGLQVRDRGLSEFLASQPHLAEGEAVQSGLADAMAELMFKAQATGGMRDDAVVEDVPTLICGLGAVMAGAPDSLSRLNWERFVEIMLDGLRAPGANALPPPRRVIQRT
jgi:AcrR family transcriptional regulator